MDNWPVLQLEGTVAQLLYLKGVQVLPLELGGGGLAVDGESKVSRYIDVNCVVRASFYVLE